LAGAVATGNVNVWQALRTIDFVGLMCLLACLGLSVASWLIVFYKLQQLKTAERQSDAFDKQLDSSGSLEDAYRRATDYPQSPIAQILREAYVEMESENWYSDEVYQLEERLTAARLGVERVMERTIATELRQMESHLVFLATTSSVAPFVGLFGTVWGVLAAFQSLSTSGSAALASLAPGIATALVTTVAGLIAAIPASIFYNYLTSKTSNLASRMDSFALELANIIQKRLIKQTVAAGDI